MIMILFRIEGYNYQRESGDMEINSKEIIKKIERNFNEVIEEEIILGAIKLSKVRRFEKGDIILGMGEAMEKAYFIMSGIARSYYLDMEGNDITKSFIKEYEFCVGESIITTQKSGEGFEALENMIVLEFNAKQLKEYLFSHQGLTRIYVKILEKTILYKMNRENGFQIKSATERYLDFRKNSPNIENRVNQSYIASYLGITAVSLSRIKRTIKEEN